MIASIIVPTRDRPDSLPRCLTSIAHSDYRDIEVIVADQSSGDGTAGIIDDLDDARFRHLRLNTTGKSKGLNAALGEAVGGIVALTDDDCEVPPDWISRSMEVIKTTPEADVVFGALVAAEHDAIRTYVPVFEPKTFSVVRRFAVRAHWLGVGANMTIRRTVFDRIGGFDELQGPGSVYRSGDDWEFAYRALKAGFAIVQDPLSIVIHHGLRDYASGAAGRLISNNYHGIGAAYARHARAGDWRAAVLLLQEFARTCGDVGSNVARLRRPFGLRRAGYLLLGAVRGLTGTPANRRTSSIAIGAPPASATRRETTAQE